MIEIFQLTISGITARHGIPFALICIQGMSRVIESNNCQALEIKDYQCKAHGRTEILSCLLHTHICNTKANALSTQKMVWKLDRLMHELIFSWWFILPSQTSWPCEFHPTIGKWRQNIEMRKQSWQCFMSLILPTFLIFRLDDTRFSLVLCHVHIIYTSLNSIENRNALVRYNEGDLVIM